MERRYQQRRSCCAPRWEEKKQPPLGPGKQEEKKQPPSGPGRQEEKKQQPPPCSGRQEPCTRQEKGPPPPPPPRHRKSPGGSTGQNLGGTSPMGVLPTPLAGLLSGNRSGDLMALMILLLLLWEGKEDSRGTILTLLIFLLL